MIKNNKYFYGNSVVYKETTRYTVRSANCNTGFKIWIHCKLLVPHVRVT